jgi:2-oxoglutarate dehydrogenase E2 component (dihydrolipoamide succinyltransferase)
MPTKIVVPELGESVLEATVGHWLKKEGDRVSVGEVLVSLETDKVDLEVGAERSGVLARIERSEGEDVKIGEVLGVIEDAPPERPGVAPAEEAQVHGQDGHAIGSVPTAAPTPAAAPSAAAAAPPRAAVARQAEANAEPAATPSARRLARERGINLGEVTPSDGGGRVTQQDVENYLAPPGAAPETQPPALPAIPSAPAPAPAPVTPSTVSERSEERVRMSRRRQTIARRLVEAQHTAAMLTTFNEADMTSIRELRQRHKVAFQEKHGVNLGIVSFFVKACVAALGMFPRLNASLDGDEIVLKHYYDIGIAVGAADGLVVPVLRDAGRLTFAEIEKGIKQFARKADDRTLSLDDLRGGTFTITNGGVFGSLLSTPILNPPQVGILGLHKVQERPVSVNGEIISRPMMYLALSYDHRIVDGLEAVQFLVRVKELVEEPASLLLES